MQPKFNFYKQYDVFLLKNLRPEEILIILLLLQEKQVSLLLLQHIIICIKLQPSKMYLPKLKYIYATLQFLYYCLKYFNLI